MQTIIKSIVILFLAVAAFPAVAQKSTSAKTKPAKVVTKEFAVPGVCGMCKKRIENAALVKGVKTASWSKDAQKLTVVYDGRKTNEKAIQKAVAQHGHDTPSVKASDETYNKLPGCCAYRDGVKPH